MIPFEARIYNASEDQIFIPSLYMNKFLHPILLVSTELFYDKSVLIFVLSQTKRGAVEFVLNTWREAQKLPYKMDTTIYIKAKDSSTKEELVSLVTKSSIHYGDTRNWRDLLLRTFH
jgi:hypothetical protein